MQQCIESCLSCYSACLQTEAHCLRQGGDYAQEDRLRTLRDCASICRVSADFMLRNSPRHNLVCNLSEQICVQCADECRSFKNDEQMQKCGQACNDCAESCRKVTE
jgi:hypothetical protein